MNFKTLLLSGLITLSTGAGVAPEAQADLRGEYNNPSTISQCDSYRNNNLRMWTKNGRPGYYYVLMDENQIWELHEHNTRGKIDPCTATFVGELGQKIFSGYNDNVWEIHIENGELISYFKMMEGVEVKRDQMSGPHRFH